MQFATAVFSLSSRSNLKQTKTKSEYAENEKPSATHIARLKRRRRRRRRNNLLDRISTSSLERRRSRHGRAPGLVLGPGRLGPIRVLPEGVSAGKDCFFCSPIEHDRRLFVYDRASFSTSSFSAPSPRPRLPKNSAGPPSSTPSATPSTREGSPRSRRHTRGPT